MGNQEQSLDLGQQVPFCLVGVDDVAETAIASEQLATLIPSFACGYYRTSWRSLIYVRFPA